MKTHADQKAGINAKTLAVLISKTLVNRNVNHVAKLLAHHVIRTDAILVVKTLVVNLNVHQDVKTLAVNQNVHPNAHQDVKTLAVNLNAHPNAHQDVKILAVNPNAHQNVKTLVVSQNANRNVKFLPSHVAFLGH